MRLYAAKMFCKTMEVDSNLPFKIPKLELKWANGQVGALPVFATREAAEKWTGDPALVVDIETEDKEVRDEDSR